MYRRRGIGHNGEYTIVDNQSRTPSSLSWQPVLFNIAVVMVVVTIAISMVLVILAHDDNPPSLPGPNIPPGPIILPSPNESIPIEPPLVQLNACFCLENTNDSSIIPRIENDQCDNNECSSGTYFNELIFSNASPIEFEAICGENEPILCESSDNCTEEDHYCIGGRCRLITCPDFAVFNELSCACNEEVQFHALDECSSGLYTRLGFNIRDDDCTPTGTCLSSDITYRIRQTNSDPPYTYIMDCSRNTYFIPCNNDSECEYAITPESAACINHRCLQIICLDGYQFNRNKRVCEKIMTPLQCLSTMNMTNRLFLNHTEQICETNVTCPSEQTIRNIWFNIINEHHVYTSDCGEPLTCVTNTNCPVVSGASQQCVNGQCVYIHCTGDNIIFNPPTFRCRHGPLPRPPDISPVPTFCDNCPQINENNLTMRHVLKWIHETCLPTEPCPGGTHVRRYNYDASAFNWNLYSPQCLSDAVKSCTSNNDCELEDEFCINGVCLLINCGPGRIWNTFACRCW